MFVPDRSHGWRLLFSLRGSVLRRIAPQVIGCSLLAVLVVQTHGLLFSWKVTLTPVPFTLIGLALAIFLGFRNGAAYERFWEARKLWGELLHRSRTLVRQLAWVEALEPTEAARIARRTIAFAHVLRCDLRDLDAMADAAPWLDADDRRGLAAARNKPGFLLACNLQAIAQWLHQGRLPAPLAAGLDQTLAALGAVQAGCERIASTPIPYAYTLLLHRTAYLYCGLLPFGLVDQIGVMTPVVVAIVSYTFFGLDALGDEIEQPFGTRVHHLPLDGLCRTVEISLLDALGETGLPAPLAPVNGVLR